MQRAVSLTVWGSARPPKSGRVIHNSQGRSSSAGRALMSSAGRISAAAGPRHATKEPGAWPGSMVIQGYRANADLTGNLPTARSPARRRSQRNKRSTGSRIRSVATGPCRSSHARLRSLCCSARDPNFGNEPSCEKPSQFGIRTSHNRVCGPSNGSEYSKVHRFRAESVTFSILCIASFFRKIGARRPPGHGCKSAVSLLAQDLSRCRG